MKKFLVVVCVHGKCCQQESVLSRQKKSRSAPSIARRPRNRPRAKSTRLRVAANTATAGSADVGPVHELCVGLVKAFNRRDAAAFAALFTAEGEYIDETGAAFRGRRAIEQEFSTLFAAHPETKIQMHVDFSRALAAESWRPTVTRGSRAPKASRRSPGGAASSAAKKTTAG